MRRIRNRENIINKLLHSATASYSVVICLPVLCLRVQISWNRRRKPGEKEPRSQTRVQRLFQVLPTCLGPINAELCLDLVPLLFQAGLNHGLGVTHLVNLKYQQSKECNHDVHLLKKLSHQVLPPIVSYPPCKSKRIQDSLGRGFHAVDSGFQSLSVELRFRTPIVNLIQDSLGFIADSKAQEFLIPQAQFSQILDHKETFHGLQKLVRLK